ncbi:MAG TPA: hypothetical protein VJ770_10375 [Stellaceae bacterium]|nr:hypothetical protein [Stellaceae bacterium]
MGEEKAPRQWYAILKAVATSLDETGTADGPWSISAYVWAFAATPGPFSIERLDEEGPEFAKLTSSTFDGLTDYVAVLRDARKWVQMVTGAMKIKQNPSKLEIVNIVGIFDNGTIRKYPPHAPPVSISVGLGTGVGKEGAKPRMTFELAVVLFAYRSGNPLVGDVLRYFAHSPDWFDLYSIMEIIRLDLNQTGDGKKAGDKRILNRKWANKGELDAFYLTADYHRHPRHEPPKPMSLRDARQLVGRIAEQWMIEVSHRPRTASPS